MHLAGVNEAYRDEVARTRGARQPVEAVRPATVEELSALYHDGYHRFVRVAEAITRHPDDARDAVQEGFANALRELPRYRGRGSFEGWVWRCVTNAARMSLRKARRRPPSPQQPPAAEPQAPGLLEPISRLPERPRLVLFLRYFADLSYDAIAEALGVSPGTVAATLNAAHGAVRRQLEEADDEN